MLNINIATPNSMMEQMRFNFKEKRLSLELTQNGLSKRSGVSLGSLKRFESSGHISLESLLKLALVLQCLDEFQTIANIKDSTLNSMDDLLNKKEVLTKRRGTIT